MTISTHNGTHAVPFAVYGTAKEVRVYAHDSGQRYHWSYSREAAVRSCNEWFQYYVDNNLPTQCVGSVDLVPLSWIDEEDEYVGG